MSDQRRYNEEEVETIFAASADSAEWSRSTHLESDARGLTLAELQDIGRTVGLPPERIAEAARVIDIRRHEIPRRRFLGIPVGVGRIVELPRAPSDAEWELLVSELRSTFDAPGKVETTGNLRSWRHGNLHAYVEPAETGYRLRIRTVKTGAEARISLGAGGVALAWVLEGVFAINGRLASDYLAPAILGAAGLVTLGTSFFTLRRWAARREQQMELIGQRAVALLSGPGPGGQ